MSPRAAWRLQALGFSQVFDYVAGKVDWGAAGFRYEGSLAERPTAGGAANADVPTCVLDDDLPTVRERVRSSGFDTCIVINEQQIVLGRLGRQAIRNDDLLTVKEAMAEGPSTVRPSLPLAELLPQMTANKRRTALVTTLDGQLVGLVYRDTAEEHLKA